MTTFAQASAVAKNGDGEYAVELADDWAVGERPHGGYLLAILARAAVDTAPEHAPDPLAVAAQFLRAPTCAPAVVRTAIRRSGRTVTAVSAVLEQDGAPCVEATVTCGVLPAAAPHWLDVPPIAPAPPPDAVDLGADPSHPFKLGRSTELRLDATTAGFVTGRADAAPLLRLWTTPHDADPDVFFALVAGDISPPVVFNLGRVGWSPTVQLTALLRARPAPGWLAVQAESRAVSDTWFDEEHTVLDSTGALICQSRQLAIPPQPGR